MNVLELLFQEHIVYQVSLTATETITATTNAIVPNTTTNGTSAIVVATIALVGTIVTAAITYINHNRSLKNTLKISQDVERTKLDIAQLTQSTALKTSETNAQTSLEVEEVKGKVQQLSDEMNQKIEVLKNYVHILSEEDKKSLQSLKNAVQITQKVKNEIQHVIDSVQNSLDPSETVLDFEALGEKVENAFVESEGTLKPDERTAFHNIKNIMSRIVKAIRDNQLELSRDKTKNELRLFRIQLNDHQEVLRDHRTNRLLNMRGEHFL